MSYFKGFGNGSNSNGQFWYGRTQQIPPELIPSNVHPGLAKILPLGFPGFLFKKNTGVGGRKNPLYGLICNKPTDIYNKYKPGTGGVGAQNRANRRAKNARATVCVDHNCERFYNYLGLYPRFSYRSIDGYFPYPLPITYYNVTGNYRAIIDTKFKNLLFFTGDSNFSVLGFRPITLNYIFVGGGGGGGGGGNGTAIDVEDNTGSGGGGGGGGGGQIIYGQYDIYPGYYSIVVGQGGKGGTSSTNGGSGGNTYIYNNQNGTKLLLAYGGQGGFTAPGNENPDGGIGGVSTGTIGSYGGKNMNKEGENGRIGGGGGGSNTTLSPGSRDIEIKNEIYTLSPIPPLKGGNGVNNISITDINFTNIIKNVIQYIIPSDSNFTNNIIQKLTQDYGSELPDNISLNNFNLNELESILNKFDINLNFSQIFGTGGGAGNAGLYGITIDGFFDKSIYGGGKAGKSGGIIEGLGGKAYNLDHANGENALISIPYLGGGGGGGGGASGGANKNQRGVVTERISGLGGNGSDGGSGSVILFFNTV
jgi:hypothetical protein